MSDLSSIESYCSSYYDKNGLYNDGFPCPIDKYCCQSSDGTKSCCKKKLLSTTFPVLKLSQVELEKNKHQVIQVYELSTKSYSIIQILTNYTKKNNSKSNTNNNMNSKLIFQNSLRKISSYDINNQLKKPHSFSESSILYDTSSRLPYLITK
jgi:hypothetical protein